MSRPICGRPACPSHCVRRGLDVLGLPKTEPEVGDAFHLAGTRCVLLKCDDVVVARRLHLDRPRIAIHRLRTENVLVEPKRALYISDREANVRESIGPNHPIASAGEMVSAS